MNVTMTNQDASISDLRLRLSSVQPEIEKGWKESFFFFSYASSYFRSNFISLHYFFFFNQCSENQYNKKPCRKTTKKILKKGKKLISHG